MWDVVVAVWCDWVWVVVDDEEGRRKNVRNEERKKRLVDGWYCTICGSELKDDEPAICLICQAAMMTSGMVQHFQHKVLVADSL